MKIHSFPGSVQYASRVQEKPDGENSNKEGSSQKDSEQKDESFQEVLEDATQAGESSETLGKAIEAFQSDALAQANGLKASVIGQGPGLKVVLQDGDGAIIRQLSGEEFIKLRKAVKSEAKGTGKILDRKL